MTLYVIDTDVLIWVLRRDSDAVETAARDGTLACSVLTVAEILRLIRDYELPRAQRFFETLDTIPVTYEDAVRAAEMMRNRGPGLVDCHIAAAAIRLGATVITYNRKDFARTEAVLADPPSLPGGR